MCAGDSVGRIVVGIFHRHGWTHSTQPLCLACSAEGSTAWRRVFTIRWILNGGLLKHVSPQMVQTSATHLLREYKASAFPILPSGISVHSLLEQIATEEADEDQQIYMQTPTNNNNKKQVNYVYTVLDKQGRRANTLVRLLERISEFDWLVLHDVGLYVAHLYRYYELSPSMQTLPPHTHMFPDGGAFMMLDYSLNRLVHEEGIDHVQTSCEVQLPHIFVLLIKSTVVDPSVYVYANRRNGRGRNPSISTLATFRVRSRVISSSSGKPC
jgi:hypothetical protein